jgi:Fe-S cluster assembly ATP-binding protein
MVEGRIVQSGGKELAFELEERGYDFIKDAIEQPAGAGAS